MKTIEIGTEVVRSKGDYVVGRVGSVVAVDAEKNRAQICWLTAPKSWVSFSVIEPTYIPYEIIRSKEYTFPKYKILG